MYSMYYDRLTVAWTADKSGSHADVLMPLDRMKANVPGNERRTEVVIACRVAVRVSSEFLQQKPLSTADEEMSSTSCLAESFCSIKAKFHYASWFRASSEPASVMEFGFYIAKC